MPSTTKAILLAMVGLAAAEIPYLREAQAAAVQLPHVIRNPLQALSKAGNVAAGKVRPQGYTEQECSDQTVNAFLSSCSGLAPMFNSNGDIIASKVAETIPNGCTTACINAMSDISAWYRGNSSVCDAADGFVALCTKDGNTWCGPKLLPLVTTANPTTATIQATACTNCGLKVLKKLAPADKDLARSVAIACARSSSGKFCLDEGAIGTIANLDTNNNAVIGQICKNNECQRKVIYAFLTAVGYTSAAENMCVSNPSGQYCFTMDYEVSNLTTSSCATAKSKVAALGCCMPTLANTRGDGLDFNYTDYLRQVRECTLVPAANACSLTKTGDAKSKSIRTSMKWSWVQSRQAQVAAAIRADISTAMLVPVDSISVALSQAPLNQKFATLAVDATTATVTMQGQTQAQTNDMATTLNTLTTSGTLMLPSTEILYANSGVRTGVTASNPPSPKASGARGLLGASAAVAVAFAIAVLAL